MDESRYARLFHRVDHSHLEALSLVVREAVWNNFVSVLLPRLQEGCGVLICSRRWHQDDLVGRLLG